MSEQSNLFGDDVVLVCEGCSHRRVLPADATVHGLPVLEWWESVGRRCTACRTSAAGPTKVHRNGHDTEYAAARSIEASAAILRRLVLRTLQAHPDGLTDDEGAALIGGDRLRFGRRRNELADVGLVADTGRRRKTPSGRSAIVWAIRGSQSGGP